MEKLCGCEPVHSYYCANCYEKLEQRLAEAEKVIEFYADMRRWKYSGFNNLYAWIVLDDIEQVNEIDRVGGKHAREYQAKFINVASGEAAR